MTSPKTQVLKLLNSLPDNTSAEVIEREIAAMLHREAAEFGDGGRELARKVWQVEDFSDWKTPDAAH